MAPPDFGRSVNPISTKGGGAHYPNPVLHDTYESNLINFKGFESITLYFMNFSTDFKQKTDFNLMFIFAESFFARVFYFIPDLHFVAALSCVQLSK